MKIGYFGDGPWAHLALEKILSNQALEVAFIVARFETKDPVLAAIAKKNNIPFLIHANVNSADFINLLQTYQADIFVSMSFNQILKKEIINLPKKGFINCHAGALPFYRGRNILNWALINGESHFGVTVHYIDEGIDTGDIILQELVAITKTDFYGDLLKKAIGVCAELLHQALKLIAENKQQRKMQSLIHKIGFYCNQRTEGDEWIDWSWGSERIYNFVRGISSPGPNARTIIDHKTLCIIKAELIDSAPSYIGNAGQVVGKTELGNIVKTGDNTLLVTQVAYIDSTGKLENIHKPQYKIGTKFGMNLHSIVMDYQNRIAQLEKQIKS
jgi:methionyl-tRNA formyltransferase